MAKARSLTRRELLVGVAAAGVGAALAACVATPAPSLVEETPAAEKEAEPKPTEGATITFIGRSSRDEGNYRELAQRFEAEHPDIKVKIQWVPSQSDLDKSVLLQLAAGTAPDVLLTHSYTIEPMARRGALLALDEFITGDEEFDTDAYFPGALEGYKIAGKQWGIARIVTSWFLVYNQTLFEEKGVELPQPDSSWDDFLLAAKALTQGTGAEKTYGCGGFDSGYVPTLVLTWQRGGM